MRKHYHAGFISFIGIMVVALSVGVSAPRPQSGHGVTFTVSPAFADGHDGHESSHHYGSDGYNKDGYDKYGRDHDGYDHDGYKSDGRHRDGHHDDSHDLHGQPENADQDFDEKPTVKQY